MSIDVDGGRIAAFYIARNPEEPRAIEAHARSAPFPSAELGIAWTTAVPPG